MKSAITLSLVDEARGGPFVFWGDAKSAIAQAQQIGFDAIEIFPPDADTLRHLFLAKPLADHGLSVAAVGTGAGWVKHRLQLADEDQIVRQRAINFIRTIIDCAAEFGAPAIIGSMQGRSSQAVKRETANAYLRDGLESLNRHAGQYGTNILFEPLNRYETDQANTLEQGLTLIDGLSNVRLLADLFHMNIEEVNVANAIRRAGNAIGHVHFADSNRMAVGFGHLNVPPVIAALQEIGYPGYLSAEVFSKPDAMKAAQQTIDAFRIAMKTT
ncbi:MAG TPA: sugar phosphate isomerase/epimerase family protein [Pirellula sp.]|nr:sugar phosphate isomerase/epimerase family protein [Pirellula sp.]